MSDYDIEADAFASACAVEPDVQPSQVRRIIDAYLQPLHIHVRQMHEERDLTPAEVLGAFAPRTVEF